MTAAARSSSAAPSRSEQRTRSTSHRPGAICASDVTRGAGGGAGSGGGSGGVADCCGGGADGCAHALRQHASRTAKAYLFIAVPLVPIRISVTGARTARRTSTYCTSNRTEAGPDRGAAPGIPGNRPDQGAPGRPASGTLEGAGGNG